MTEPEWAGARHMNFEDDERLLTDELKEVIRKAKTQIFQDAGGIRLSYHQIGQIIEAEVAKALRAKDNQKIEGLFKEIEEQYGPPAGHPQADDWGVAICKEDWQSLKDKYGGVK